MAKELSIKEVVVSHETDLPDILKMNFHGVTPGVVIQGRISVMISKYCTLGDLNFCGGNEEGQPFFLENRKVQYYPIITNPDGCQSVLLSHKQINLSQKKADLKKVGINHFRIYVV